MVGVDQVKDNNFSVSKLFFFIKTKSPFSEEWLYTSSLYKGFSFGVFILK